MFLRIRKWYARKKTIRSLIKFGISKQEATAKVDELIAKGKRNEKTTN